MKTENEYNAGEVVLLKEDTEIGIGSNDATLAQYTLPAHTTGQIESVTITQIDSIDTDDELVEILTYRVRFSLQAVMGTSTPVHITFDCTEDQIITAYGEDSDASN